MSEVNESKQLLQTKRVNPQGSEFLSTIDFDGHTHTRDLPKTNLKGVFLTLKGKIKANFDEENGDKPLVKSGSLFNSLVESIEVIDRLGTLIDVKIDDLKFHTRRYTGNEAPTMIAQGESLDGAEVGKFEFSENTGEWISFLDVVWVPFELEIAEVNFLSTVLQYNGKDTNNIRVKFNDIKEIQKTNFQVQYDHEITLDIQCSTTADRGQGKRWKRYSKERRYVASVTDDIVELNSVENLMGLKIEMTKGPDNIPLTLDEASNVKFKFFTKRPGSNNTVKEDSLVSIMFNDLSKKRISEIKAGTGYMNFISSNFAESAITNNYTDFQLRVSIPSSQDFSEYVNLRVFIDELE